MSTCVSFGYLRFSHYHLIIDQVGDSNTSNGISGETPSIPAIHSFSAIGFAVPSFGRRFVVIIATGNLDASIRTYVRYEITAVNDCFFAAVPRTRNACRIKGLSAKATNRARENNQPDRASNARPFYAFMSS